MTTPPRVPLFDSARHYGLITRALHWTTAALLAWQWTGMILRELLGRQPVVAFFVRLHQPLGAVLLGLIVLRIVWALVNRRRRPEHVGMVGAAARLGHLALYAVMLAVPALGLLRAFGGTRPFAPFGVVLHPGREVAIGWMVAPANLLHGPMAWALLVMVTGHVVMVGVHQAMWRDGTLARMAGRLT